MNSRAQMFFSGNEYLLFTCELWIPKAHQSRNKRNDVSEITEYYFHYLDLGNVSEMMMSNWISKSIKKQTKNLNELFNEVHTQIQP